MDPSACGLPEVRSHHLLLLSNVTEYQLWSFSFLQTTGECATFLFQKFPLNESLETHFSPLVQTALPTLFLSAQKKLEHPLICLFRCVTAFITQYISSF